ASSTPDGTTASANGTNYTDFQAVISGVLGSIIPDCDANCNANIIDFPPPYDKNVFVGALAPAFRKEVTREADGTNCMCEQYNKLEMAYTYASTNNLTTAMDMAEYLAELDLSDIPITQDRLDDIDGYCNPNISACTTLPKDLLLPPYLQCDVCISCETMQMKKTAFSVSCTPMIEEDDLLYSQLRAQYLNLQFGFTATPEEYDAYFAEYTSCIASDAVDKDLIPTQAFCPSTAFGTVEYDGEGNCRQALEYQATVNAIQAYNAEIEELKTRFRQEYLSSCLNDLSGESFTVTGDINEYHYTLYYYDQAGNLVQTIPPDGVEVLDVTELSRVQDHRTGAIDDQTNMLKEPNPITPNHTYQTRYLYNSLNEVVRQDAPDTYTSTAGDKEGTEMWYDR
ncbi:MAG: hypothetical protein AAF738_11865, partial [Bacteroidota bacterium]